MKVIVVGGSLGGLFAGIVAKSQGHSVHILERHAAARVRGSGAGIVLGESIREFLSRFAPNNQLETVVSDGHFFLDRAGNIIRTVEKHQETTSWDQLYLIAREAFDGGEIESKYLEGHAFTKAEVRIGDGKVEVSYTDADGMLKFEDVDLLLGADGAFSALRRSLLADVAPSYAGYVAWRGIVMEDQITPAIFDLCLNKLVFYNSPGCQMAVYVVPGEEGKRYVNWVWYCNSEENSLPSPELMTGNDGSVHRVTLQAGQVRPEVWLSQKQLAHKVLPLQLSEIVQSTCRPFVQAIWDVISPQNSFHEGKVILIGDAVAGLRPHTGAGTEQAAFHSLALEKLLNGSARLEEFVRLAMEHSRNIQNVGVQIGESIGLGAGKEDNAPRTDKLA
ncbi:uncharacterized protein ACLA_062360 [Aspergillus clavatus NRRL 1]|uniref:2,6-dihydroxypyridine 3-monooxygenase substrate binding domain-containing protein n=1 Tax=Aspergillus clavatus (strain ATCC 1007 / CBS 513.65 / DSM 816 / NCTC 3887 / NRRL 1 / QM 1276 / 107) TaxID=344612 RepID=A1CCL5_ASPCL|nr:uncharacterized protein ACLA_062360 [Aspergillus clavatus NRRL 1]EAW12272.1 conserved hypothetical protein [Aspergillus clavatus NRRL 1]